MNRLFINIKSVKYTQMRWSMKIGLIGAGHVFKYQMEALEKLGLEVIVCDVDNSKLINIKNKVNDYHQLLNKVDLVYVSTPPNTHFEIIKYFLENNVFVISEKPLVTSTEELNILSKLINNNFYNIFHFAFGDEILWFKNSNYMSIIPNQIKCYINDPYVEDSHIKEEHLNLHGSYLDETINPLSALINIYNLPIKYVNSSLIKYKGDDLDYRSYSLFKLGNIDISVDVLWNDFNDRSKYIDIYYDDVTLRLDSMNSSVIDLTHNKLLFKSKDVRMYKHYLNGLTDFLNNKTNKDISFMLNGEILKYKK